MGYSVFAVVAFQPGDVILCKRPLVLMPVYMSGGGPQTNGALEEAIEFIKQSRRYDLNNLSDCQNPDVPTVKGIIDTNALIAGYLAGPYDVDGLHAAVCMDLSRINHRSGLCRANIRVVPSPDKE